MSSLNSKNEPQVDGTQWSWSHSNADNRGSALVDLPVYFPAIKNLWHVKIGKKMHHPHTNIERPQVKYFQRKNEKENDRKNEGKNEVVITWIVKPISKTQSFNLSRNASNPFLDI